MAQETTARTPRTRPICHPSLSILTCNPRINVCCQSSTQFYYLIAFLPSRIKVCFWPPLGTSWLFQHCSILICSNQPTWSLLRSATGGDKQHSRIGVALLPQRDACQLQLPSRFCQCRRDAGDGTWKKQKTNIAVFHHARRHKTICSCLMPKIVSAKKGHNSRFCNSHCAPQVRHFSYYERSRFCNTQCAHNQCAIIVKERQNQISTFSQG